MENTAGSRKYRGSKDFAYRNIYVCHTVFKICFFFRIIKLMKMNKKICLIAVLTFNFHPLAGIQSINNGLLNTLIKMIIQRIDFYDFTENFREFFSDFRNRISNDRKASLVSFNISVYNLTGFIIQLNLEFLLYLTVRKRLFAFFR